jgi:hypothetical protein
MMFLPKQHPIRVFVAYLVSHQRFDQAMMVLILVSSAALAMDTPGLDKHSTMKAVLDVSDIVFVVAFAVEALLKSIAYGKGSNLAPSGCCLLLVTEECCTAPAPFQRNLQPSQW